jgi:hypothetical protein
MFFSEYPQVSDIKMITMIAATCLMLNAKNLFCGQQNLEKTQLLDEEPKLD